MEPLKDIKVLAVTVYLAGPFCSMNLARMGAEVIKVEIPGKGDPVRGNGPFAGPKGTSIRPQTDEDLSTRFLKRTQGVKSITLDLKTAKGKQMFLDMAKECDVVLENLAPGSLRRIGLGYDEVSAVNPGIVYCSISGYGQTGPYADKPAHDPQIQGMAGLMDINGEEDRPPVKVGLYIGDLVTPLFACYSILGALREKDRTGKGQYLDVSMMDTLVSLMFMENLEETIADGEPLRTGNISRSGPTGLYETKDGDLSLTVTSDEQWGRLSRALDAPSLLEDPLFKDYVARTVNVEAARQQIQTLIGKLTLDAALKCLEEFDVPCAPVRTAEQVMNDQHFWDRGSLVPMLHAAMDQPVEGVASGFPVKFSGGELPTPAGAPTLGMHNKEIFKKLLGLTAKDFKQLKEEKII
ncbi:MAG: CoA transferase [SAR202 cluster bacterium]|nr:CoA transferase [SAR202 cluster bacterium]|tara:strand:- start:20729 stop:21955 length:1227 start_codon:yes stop_codon:yes gene_type:complete